MANALARKRAVLAAVVIVGLLASGYVGWSLFHGEADSTTTAEPGKTPAEAVKPLPDFSVGLLDTLPYGEGRIGDGLKPQHWTTADLELTANRGDFRGGLSIYPSDTTPDIDRSTSAVTPLATRAVLLPKAQKRNVETTLYCPQGPSASASLRAMTRLQTSGGADVLRVDPQLSLMPAHQYHLVVLAREPKDYQFLGRLDSIRAPGGDPGMALSDAHYRIALVRPGAPPLPSDLIRWTSIAYVIWDDRDPNELTPDQQQAFVDWLHWGGQLIVSGPDTLETLRSSFLAPYLPAKSGGSWQLDSSALDGWFGFGTQLFLTKPQVVAPWSAVRLVPSADAEVLAASGDDPLIVERRVGRGRTVVTAFRLAQQGLVAWQNFDGVFNSLLLRRPARTFFESPDAKPAVRWSSNLTSDDATTRLRILSRDPLTATEWSPGDSDAGYLNQYPVDGGVVAWNDSSPVSYLVRDGLQDSAGVIVPERSFVAKFMLGYVIALVPANWLVFRLLRRVEYAWIVAPLITLGFAVAVVKMADLDIGFVRTRTEIDVLEMHAGHPRAHMTRYTALYSSLGTQYQMNYADRSAVGLPMSDDFAVSERIGVPSALITFREHRAAAADESAVSLEGFDVSSNTTAMIHSEQMFNAGGPITLVSLGGGRYRLENHSTLSFEAVTVGSEHSSAWLGTIAAGESREFELSAGSSRDRRMHKSERNVAEAWYGVLATFPESPELRLVGWVDAVQPGLEVAPHAAQVRGGSIVVVQLEYPPLPDVEADANTRADIQRSLGPADLLPSTNDLPSFDETNP